MKLANNNGRSGHRCTRRKEIFHRAIVSRCIIMIGMMISCSFLPDFDPGHDVVAFYPTDDGNVSSSIYFGRRALSAFTRWDAARFLRLARDPTIRIYEKLEASDVRESDQILLDAEEAHAFYPLFPTIVHYIAKLWPYDVWTNSILSALTLNIVSFSLAAICLDELAADFFSLSAEHSSTIYLSKEELDRVVDYFIWNPANIFFTTCYSESIFALLVYLGYMLHTKSMLSRGRCSLYTLRIGATISFTLASSTRSNGILVIPFLIVNETMCFLRYYRSDKAFKKFLLSMLFAVISVFTICAPMWMHNMNGYERLCLNKSQQEGYCNVSNRAMTLNNIYASVQKKHWNVGLFNFYELKQLPNFLLASPILFIALKGVYDHLYFVRSLNQFSFFNFVTEIISNPVSPHMSVLFLSTTICIMMAHVHISTRHVFSLLLIFLFHH